MINPWGTSNPFMSMWFSAANQMIGVTQGLMATEMRRQAAAIQAEFERQVVDFWTGGWMKPPRKPRRVR